MVTVAEEASRVKDESRIRAVLDRPGRPDSIHGYQLEFGEDHSGDPAVWVWLLVRDDNRSPQELQELLNTSIPYSRSVGTELIGMGLEHWPYVRFRTWVTSAE